MAGGVGQVLGLFLQGFPFGTRQAPGLEVRPGPFSAMVEEPLVVVTGLQGRDLVGDEGVELGQIGDEVCGQGEIHQAASSQARKAPIGGLVDGRLVDGAGLQMGHDAGRRQVELTAGQPVA